MLRFGSQLRKQHCYRVSLVKSLLSGLSNVKNEFPGSTLVSAGEVDDAE